MNILSGLGMLADDFNRWRFRALKAEEELETLRMHLHQFAACRGATQQTARSYLQAEVKSFHERITRHEP
jgi:hypothetical protein